ncbi:MAG: hypothetical protein E7017_00825 [Alphaproteobacteria bacterium]|nr:hypothetical protein [Alphaproteobacteria bacterium]
MKIHKFKVLLILVMSISVLAVMFNILAALLLDGVTVDLTPDKTYSLSDVSKNMLKNNKEDIVIRFYVSDNLYGMKSELGQYARYLHKLLSEYVRKSDGKISLMTINVKPFTNSQAEAEKSGIKELETAEGKNYLYLGASFSNAKGKTKAIDRFLLERKRFVEDDITRMLSVLTQNENIKIGMLSPFFQVTNTANPMIAFNNWPFVEQLNVLGYNVVGLRETTPIIDDSFDVVLVFYPLGLDKRALYALEQYLLRGGNVIVMLDSFAEERFIGKNKYFSYNSGMQSFFAANGLEYVENVLVGDNVNNRNIMLEGRLTQYPFNLTLTGDLIKKHDITEGIGTLLLNHSGFFEYENKQDLMTTVLVETSLASGVMLARDLTNLSYETLIKDYQVTNSNYPLVLLMEGKFTSSFDHTIVFDENILKKMPVFLKKSKKEGKMLLVADIDMLSDRLWKTNIQDENGYGFIYLSDNIHFIRNTIDYMTNSQLTHYINKYKVGNNISIANSIMKMVDGYFADRIKNASDELINVRKDISEQREKTSGQKVVSINAAKKIENLTRQEIKTEKKLRKLIYQSGKMYDFLVSFFGIFIVFIVPLLEILTVWIVYKCFCVRIRQKTRILING